MRSGADSNRTAMGRSTEITEPLRPATRTRRRHVPASPPGFEPGLTRLELVVLPLHHGLVKRTTRVERASPEWRSGALPAELRPHGIEHARLGSNQRLPPSQDGALSTELRAYRASGRIRTRTPAVQRACAAVDTTEALMETAGVEPAPPRCKRGVLPEEPHPRVMRTDGVEPSQHEATRLQRAELAGARASA